MNSYCIIAYLLGIILTSAYDNLSYKKVATQSHTSPGNNYVASKAVDGDIATCMRTQDIGGNTPYKTVWWKVDLGGVFSIYRINILFKDYEDGDSTWKDFTVRQRGRFAGFSLYISENGLINGSTLCYKDGPELPALNFSTTCIDYKRYVIFYNERIAETYPEGYVSSVVFTELCEVNVQGCSKPGVYGNNCDIKCPINCENNTCNIEIGTCLSCKPGWTGKFCKQECNYGSYGVNCSKQCTGHCRDGTSCNHVTGQCNGGCDAGWTGFLCDKECNEGTFGYDCINNCSGHCLNKSPCNKQTGHCDSGCNSGYTTEDCNNGNLAEQCSCNL